MNVGISPELLTRFKANDQKGTTYARHLSQLIQCKTLSWKNDNDTEQFEKFHHLLASQYPSLFARMEKIRIDTNFLYRWPGHSSDHAILLMAHSDIVDAGNDGWSHPPFSGDLINEEIWGRGTLDTKQLLCAFFSAAEELTLSGFCPCCDIFFLSSCDEECGTGRAQAVADWFKSCGIQLLLVLDEGGNISSSPYPFFDGTCATVGICEKGAANILFTAHSSGGHASTPSPEDAIPKLAEFIHYIQTNSVFEEKLPEFIHDIFAFKQNEMLPPYSDLDLRSPSSAASLLSLLKKNYSASAALLKTTVAFTMLQGGDAPNALPSAASVTANVRLSFHDNLNDVMTKLTNIANRFGISSLLLSGHDSSTCSNIKHSSYQYTEAVLQREFGPIHILPWPMFGGTDSRHFSDRCPVVLRFSPIIVTPEQISGVHGINERISVASLEKAVAFYKTFIGNLSCLTEIL